MNCPAHVNCSGFIKYIKAQDFYNAFKIICENLPLPESITRICNKSCEKNCVLALKNNAINISQLKIFLCNIFKNNIFNLKELSSKKQIAIIGGGPAGLCAGYFLRKLGYEIFIYDAMPKMGGMLRYGIPEYRLPKKILDREINFLYQAKHINFYNNFLVTKKIFLDLKSKFSAIIICTGAWQSLKLDCKNNKFIYDGIKFLNKISQDKNLIKKKIFNKKIAVIGGGNTALDVARTSIKLGAREVINIYRRSQNEMLADLNEICAAQQEGVKFKFLLAPEKIIFKNHEKILYLREYKLSHEKDLDLRYKILKANNIFREKFDFIISAIGQKANLDFIEQENININNFFKLNHEEKIFAIGDVINLNQDRTAINAIAQAKKLADIIHNFLQNKSSNSKIKKSKCEIINKNYFRADKINLANKKIYSPEEALREANRCLNCGGCHENYKKNI